MKLLLKVSIFEWCDVGADYAFVDLTQEWARSLLKRKAIFDVAHAQETELYEMHFWWDPCLWLGGDLEDVPEDADLWEFLDEHLSEGQLKQLSGGYVVVLPDDVEVPEYFAQRTEMGQTVVTEDDVYFTSYPKHVDHEQHTMDIPWVLIEQVVAQTAGGRYAQ